MIRVNLLPEAQRPCRAARARVLWGAAAASLAVVLGLYAFFALSLQQEEQELQRWRNRHEALRPVEALLFRQARQEQAVVAQEQRRQRLLHQAPPWAEVLAAVSRLQPPQVWLQELAGDPQGKVRLKGLALTNGDLVQFMQHLEEEPLFAGLSLSVAECEEHTALTRFELALQVRGR